jgi:hypothetical protein
LGAVKPRVTALPEAAAAEENLRILPRADALLKDPLPGTATAIVLRVATTRVAARLNESFGSKVSCSVFRTI